MKLSDLDISPVEIGGVARKSGNPLYGLRTREKDGSCGGSFSGEGEVEDQGEESDLDGHTLSCSLELMSDLEGGWSYGCGSPHTH